MIFPRYQFILAKKTILFYVMENVFLAEIPHPYLSFLLYYKGANRSRKRGKYLEKTKELFMKIAFFHRKVDLWGKSVQKEFF